MIIERHMQRVMMLRAGEEMPGGAPDAALSAELDRMSRPQLQFKELVADGFILSLQVKGHGPSGWGSCRGSSVPMSARCDGRLAEACSLTIAI